MYRVEIIIPTITITVHGIDAKDAITTALEEVEATILQKTLSLTVTEVEDDE